MGKENLPFLIGVLKKNEKSHFATLSRRASSLPDLIGIAPSSHPQNKTLQEAILSNFYCRKCIRTPIPLLTKIYIGMNESFLVEVRMLGLTRAYTYLHPKLDAGISESQRRLLSTQTVHKNQE
jgi:hypothetical protein